MTIISYYKHPLSAIEILDILVDNSYYFYYAKHSIINERVYPMSGELREKFFIALVSMVGASFGTWFVTASTTRLTDANAMLISRAIIDDLESRSILLRAMAEDGRFVGPTGLKGEKGDTGLKGDPGSSATVCDESIRLQNQADLNLYLHLHTWPGANGLVGGHPAAKTELGGMWQVKC